MFAAADRRVSPWLDWLLRQLDGPRSRSGRGGNIALGFAGGLILGAAIFFAWPGDPTALSVTTIGLLFPLGLVALLLLQYRLSAGLLIVLALVCGLGLGFARSEMRTGAFDHDIEISARAVPVNGWIEAVDRASNGRPRLLVRLADREAPVRVRVLAQAGEFGPGDSITLNAVLEAPRRAAVPGGFDSRFFFYFRGIAATGYAVTPVRAGEALEQDRWARSVARLRADISQRVTAQLEGREGALAAALLTGQRGYLTADDQEVLRASGLGHILAISGLHMALLAGGVFVFVRWLTALISPWAGRGDTSRPAAIAALLAATVYLVLSGGAIPTQRAYIMAVIALLAVIANRRPVSRHTLALAAIAVVLIQPEALMGAGFQMSFAAVAALIVVAERWPGGGGGRLRQALSGLSMTSLVAGTATAGVAAFHFHRLAQFGLLANLLAMPVFSFLVMPLGIAALILMPFGLEALPLWLMGQGIGLVFAIADAVAGLPGAITSVPAAPAGVFALYAGGFALAVLGQSGVRLAGLAGLGLAMALWAAAPQPDLLVTETGQLVLRQDDGWVASDRRRDRFARRVFLERQAASGGAGRASAACDAVGCGYQLDDMRLVRVNALEGLAEDCRRAGLIIASVDVPAWLQRGCEAEIVDAGQLARSGALIAWFEEGRLVRIRHADPDGPVRRWM